MPYGISEQEKLRPAAYLPSLIVIELSHVHLGTIC